MTVDPHNARRSNGAGARSGRRSNMVQPEVTWDPNGTQGVNGSSMRQEQRASAGQGHLRLAFAGVGRIGFERYCDALEHGPATAAAVFDPNPEVQEACQGKAPDVALVDELDDLFDHDVDALVVASPNAFHREQAVAGFEHGLPVFCQKPLGRNADEVRTILDAARTADKRLGVDVCYRYTESIQHMRRLIAEQEIGRLYSLDLVFHNAYGPDKAWFMDPRLSGGGCLLDLGVHLADLAFHLAPDRNVEHCSSRLWRQGARMSAPDGTVSDLEDHAQIQLDLEGDLVARLECSWNAPMGCDAVIGATALGTEGSVEMRNLDGSYYELSLERRTGRQRQTLIERESGWRPGAMQAWLDGVVRDPSFDPVEEAQLRTALLLDQARREPWHSRPFAEASA